MFSKKGGISPNHIFFTLGIPTSISFFAYKNILEKHTELIDDLIYHNFSLKFDHTYPKFFGGNFQTTVYQDKELRIGFCHPKQKKEPIN